MEQDSEKIVLRALHDMGAPLRAIRLLVDLTSEGSEPLGPETRENLALMAGRARRAESLLEQLCDYVMFEVRPEVPQPIDTYDVCSEITDEFSGCGFSITTRGQWPSVTLPAKAFRSALTELVTNAVKHHGKASGNIVIDATPEAGRLRIEISDDGKGIDERFHQEIFEFCKTLQSQDQIEGNGMGLTLIRRALNCHGGDICVHSTPGKGSRFVMHWSLHP